MPVAGRVAKLLRVLRAYIEPRSQVTVECRMTWNTETGKLIRLLDGLGPTEDAKMAANLMRRIDAVLVEIEDE